MSTFTGTGRVDKNQGTQVDDLMFGEGGNDVLNGQHGNDLILGGGGNDILHGEHGDDVVFGSGSTGGKVDFNKMVIAQDVKGTVTFLGETAGYQNALGMYKIAADGKIYGVEMLFANASLKGSGGDLLGGKSSVSVDLKAGDRVGFFVVPNAYAQSNMAQLLSDKKGSFKFVGADGKAGNVNGGSELKLVHVNDKGVETLVKSQYGNSVFHSFGGAEGGLNGDKFKHVNGEVKVADGSVKIGFEDLWKGGDKDFDDSIIRFDIGRTNAALLAKEATKTAKATDDDKIYGGHGDDQLFGMGGNDVIRGGHGDDKMWGNSGNDKMVGGHGNDTMSGGSGDDVMRGAHGNDTMSGNSGNDDMRGGQGNDKLSGNSGNDTMRGGQGDDKLDGGSGNDVMFADEGNDYYKGGGGFDTIDYSASKKGIVADLSKHTITSDLGKDEVWSIEKIVGSSHNDVIKGDKNANVIIGGKGDDVMTGHTGADTFVWSKDDAGKGRDRITDFSKEDRLDLKAVTGGDASLVKVADSKAGAVVSVKVGGAFVDVVTVDGWSAADLLASGHILS